VWYNFQVSNYAHNETYTFILRGLSGHGKLYNRGLRPVYRAVPSEDKWDTIPGDLSWRNEVDGFQLRFDHTFNSK